MLARALLAAAPRAMLARALLAAAAAAPAAALAPAVPFVDCAAAADPRTRLAVAAVYAQIRARVLHLALVAASPAPILDLSNATNLLSTVFAPTTILTFLLNPANQAQFCATLRPPSPLPAPAPAPPQNYCPRPPGPLAFAVAVPLARDYQLTTLDAHVRVVDTSSPPQELACVRLALTPLRPAPASVYGPAVAVFWLSVALAAAYWLVVGAARLAAAAKRGRQRVHNHLWSRLQGLGFVLASAISGERLASAPALMRFATPSMRDVIFHTQWCALLAMVAVQWPRFVYPFFAQTAWAALLYNVSLTQDPSRHWDPLHADFSPPPAFADQLADPASPLFLDPTIPNAFFSLPPDAPSGIPALAAAVGIRAQDAFGNAVGLFLLIIAGTIVLSFLVFALDWSVGALVRAAERRSGSAAKDLAESPEPLRPAAPIAVRFRPAARTGWLSHRLGRSSFHGSVLYGNLVRILILFHLPVTVFSCFQFAQGTARSSLAAVILAALAFAVFSISIPAWLVLRLSTTPTSKLYEETRTLLELGPLYNHYAHGSQLFACLFFTSNIAYGLALGCGQRSGSAQAIILLVGEVAAALTTSVWLPWARGARMGGLSFMLCVARIITAVLLVILSPLVAVGAAAGGWLAYAVLAIQALVFLALLLLLAAKLAEGAARALRGVPFDRSLWAPAPAAPAPPRARALLAPPRAPAAPPPPPAGVLRPEQLTQPYREDSDGDDEGFILGAWRDDDAADDAPAPAPAPAPAFRRVAGGRAHVDAPYTLAPGAGAGARAAAPARAAITPRAAAPQGGAWAQVRALLFRARRRAAAPPPALHDAEAAGASFVVIRERR